MGRTLLLLLLLIFPCAAHPPDAAGQTPSAQEVEGVFAFFDAARGTPGGVPVIGLEGGDTYPLSETGLEQIERMEGAGATLLAPGRSLLRLGLDAEGRVVSVTLVRVGTGEGLPDRAPVRRAEAVDAWARTLQAGAKVEVDSGGGRVLYKFLRYQFPDLYLADARVGSSGIAVVDIAKVRSFNTLGEAAPATADGRTGSAPATAGVDAGLVGGIELRPGLPVDIDGVRGFVVGVGETHVELRTPDGETIRLPVAEVQEARRIPLAALVRAEEAGAPQTASDDGERVSLDVVSGAVDFTSNDFVVRGHVALERDERLLIGASVRVRVRGAEIVPPAKQVRIARFQRSEGIPLSELAAISGTFVFEGIQHRAIQVEGRTLVLQLGEIERERRVELAPVLPGVPLAWEARTNVYTTTDPTVELEYDESNLLPFDDERAFEALIEAYEKGAETQRSVALTAISKSGDVRFLGVLLWHYYVGPEGARKALREAFSAFGEPGRGYLLSQLDDAHADHIEVTLGGEVERRELRPAAKRVAIIELLEQVDEQVAFEAALRFAASPTVAEDLQARAREVFFAHPAQAVNWLTQKLSADDTSAATVMLELQVRDPETLPRLFESLGLAREQPELAREIAALPDPRERARRYLGRIIGHLQADQTKEAELALGMAKGAMQDLLELQQGLRRDADLLANSWITASKAPFSSADARHWEASCLLRALALKPEHGEARRRLAAVLLGVAKELQDGIVLRGGPGDTYGAVKPLREGDFLGPDRDRAFEPGSRWLPVRLARLDTRGWVLASAVQEIPKTGDYRLVNAARDMKEIVRYLEAVRSLDANAGSQVTEALAALHGAQADEAARAGKWARALDAYRLAAGWTPTAYRQQLALAYVRANAVIPGLALVCLCGLLFAIFAPAGRGKDTAAA
jgi:hypothetical protein